MRAFASFLLILSSLPLLALLAAPNPPRPDLSGAVSVERAYYESAGLKDALLASLKLGAQEAKAEYLARIAAKDRTSGLSALVKEKSRARLIALSDSLPAYASIWCGDISEDSLASLAAGMKQARAPLICENCHPIASPECKDYIAVDPVAMQAWFEGPNSTAFSPPSGIGISIYYQGIAHASYIPVSRRVDFG